MILSRLIKTRLVGVLVRLAKLSGLTQKDISRLETGMIEKISLEDAARLAWVFGLSIDDVARVFGVWR